MRILQLVAITVIGVPAASAFSEDDALKKAQEAYVQRQVAQLSAADAKVRDEATKRLEQALPISKEQLQRELADSKDAEQHARLEKLLERYPPARKALTQEEIDAVRGFEGYRALVTRLYKEYQAEEKRVTERMASRKDRNGVASGKGAIAKDVAKLLPTAIYHIWDLPTVEIKSPDGNVVNSIGPKEVLEAAFKAYTRNNQIESMKNSSKMLLQSLQPLSEITNNEKPPTDKQWESIRKTLKDTIESLKVTAGENATTNTDSERVSMVFQDACLLDVLETMTVQCRQLLFFDPSELRDKALEARVSQRLEDVTWKDALTKVLEPAGMKYEIREGEEPGVHVSRKEK